MGHPGMAPALPSSLSMLSSHIRRSSPGWRRHHVFPPWSLRKGETEARADDALSRRVLPTSTSRQDMIDGAEVTLISLCYVWLLGKLGLSAQSSIEGEQGEQRNMSCWDSRA